MQGMFEDARSFNQPLNNWNVSNVKNMEGIRQAKKQFLECLDPQTGEFEYELWVTTTDSGASASVPQIWKIYFLVKESTCSVWIARGCGRRRVGALAAEGDDDPRLRRVDD